MNIPYNRKSITGGAASLTWHQHATRAAFLVTGVAISAWAPLVPLMKGGLQLDDAGLGTLLLTLGTGSIAGMPLAGALAARHGCRVVILCAAVVTSLMLPLLAGASSVAVAAIALFCFGASIGALDCAMNIQAVVIERQSDRRMMSGFHGLYSAGGIVGAGGMTIAFSLGASPVTSAAAISVLLCATIILFRHGLLRDRAPGEGPAFLLPKGVVVFIGALCFISFLAEGAVLDWSGVQLSAIGNGSQAWVGAGFAAFSATMTIGRLTGDGLVSRLGGASTLVLGAISASAGLACAALSNSLVVSVMGFAVVGLGCANIVPVLFSAAARQTDMPQHAAIAAVTTIGYAGVLTGPAAIGFAAQSIGLVPALLCVAGGLLLIALSARAVQR